MPLTTISPSLQRFQGISENVRTPQQGASQLAIQPESSVLFGQNSKTRQLTLAALMALALYTPSLSAQSLSPPEPDPPTHRDYKEGWAGIAEGWERGQPEPDPPVHRDYKEGWAGITEGWERGQPEPDPPTHRDYKDSERLTEEDYNEVKSLIKRRQEEAPHLSVREIVEDAIKTLTFLLNHPTSEGKKLDKKELIAISDRTKRFALNGGIERFESESEVKSKEEAENSTLPHLLHLLLYRYGK